MADKLQAPRGTRDLFGATMLRFTEIEASARALFLHYGYSEIRTPIFEDRGLFERSVGDATDIVTKELYRFEDQKGRKLALRPEGTAGVVRAFIENHLETTQAVAKYFYLGPMFRYERPQAGRYRQFYQLGCELFGATGVAADLETIEVSMRLLDRLGVEATLRLNHLGTPEDRSHYAATLSAYFEAHRAALCSTCHDRIARNPLRLLDCKVEGCRAVAKDAPAMTLGDVARGELDRLIEGLGQFDITVEVDPRLVRGLDYYTGMVFEMVSTKLGAQDAVLGGGRYDNLVHELGGPRTPAVGFAIGIDRFASLLDDRTEAEAHPHPFFYVVGIGADAQLPAARITRLLRRIYEKNALVHGSRPAWIEQALRDRSLKASMKEADRLKVSFVAMIGEDELRENRVTIRCMSSGEQFLVSLAGLGNNEAMAALERAINEFTEARNRI